MLLRLDRLIVFMHPELMEKIQNVGGRGRVSTKLLREVAKQMRNQLNYNGGLKFVFHFHLSCHSNYTETGSSYIHTVSK